MIRRTHDIEGHLHLLTAEQGGRTTVAQSGYRPAHKLYDNYLTSGVHEYPEGGGIAPGETAHVRVWFITPDVYPSSLWVGRVLQVSEGARAVGTLTVTEVLNPVLRGCAERYSPVWAKPAHLRYGQTDGGNAAGDDSAKSPTGHTDGTTTRRP